jgi:hypothetical protein
MSFSVDLKNTKIAKMAAVAITIADATSTHSPMIIYATSEKHKIKMPANIFPGYSISKYLFLPLQESQSTLKI